MDQSNVLNIDRIPNSLHMQGLKDEAVNQREALYKEISSIRAELQQVRDDRDSQRQQLQQMTGEIEKYKLYTEKSSMELNKLTLKTKNLEVCCYLGQSVVQFMTSQPLNSYTRLVSSAGEVPFPKHSNKGCTRTASGRREEIASIIYFSRLSSLKWHQ